MYFVRSRHFLLGILILLSLGALTACGGAASSPGGGNTAPAPTIQITADKASITTGQSVTLSWSSTNATAVTITGVSGTLAATGTTTVSPTTNTTYTATATGSGGTATATVTITVAAPVKPTITTFTATPTNVVAGAFTTLAWQTTNATSVTISPATPGEDNQQLPLSGSTTAVPKTTTTYTLTATGPGGTATATVAVTVTQPVPTLTLKVTPTSIIAGQKATLSWTATNATSVSIDNGVGNVGATTGTQDVTPTTTTTYTATATGPGGSITQSVTVTVQQQLAVTLTADKTQIGTGQTVTLTWTSQGASSVDLQPGIGAVNLSGSVTTAALTQTVTYTATAKDAAGNTKTAQVTITVAPPGALTSIKHIIFLVQENRSFDNYFGMLPQYRAAQGLPASDVNGLDVNTVLQDENGVPVHPYHQVTTCAENTSPSWNPSWYSYDSGKMDNFIKAHDIRSTIDPEYHRTMAYYDQTDLPYYYDAATQFATSDTWFSPVMAGTIPNRMYLFTGTSFGHIFPDPPPQGGFQQKTIFELLRDNKVSWRYYYQDNSIFLAQFAAWNDPAITSNVFPISDYYKTLADPNADTLLPSVIFIERAGEWPKNPNGDICGPVSLTCTSYDEHPDAHTQAGAARVKQIADALLASKAWQSSVLILTYDEAGGLYDHVPILSAPAPDNIQPIASPGFEKPLPGDFAHTGFRMPLIVMSPWVKPHFVSHKGRDSTSILKLIEKRFSLPALTARDAWADDMTEFFDFTSPHWLTPPVLKEQPTTSPCDFTREIEGQK